MLVKTHVHLNRHIRTLNRIIKNANNEAKAFRDAATYYQTEIDSIKERFGLTDFKDISEQSIGEPNRE